MLRPFARRLRLFAAFESEAPERDIMTTTEEGLCEAADRVAALAEPRLGGTLLNGLSRRCPACGEGPLFRGYLKRNDSCGDCGENFVGLDADDAPAWLTISIAGHVLIPLLFYLETEASLPVPVEAAILMLAATATVLLVLPFAKGLFIALLWWNGRSSELTRG